MGKITGFKEFEREEPGELSPEERVKHSREFYVQLPTPKLREQGARCMDCGIPFCHSACPLGNMIPDWNDLVYRDEWHRAAKLLQATNNFPEITGRVCPAPCEEACVLSINAPAVTIKNIEYAIIERAYEEGWIVPREPAIRSGKKVAVIGSGPAGLACADQLNVAGHEVTVYERADKIGGLLRYGIPDFKLSKSILDRRLEVLECSGITFKTGIEIGRQLSFAELQARFDAVVLATGASKPRDLSVPGRDFSGVHFAMEFLAQQNARVAGNSSWRRPETWWFSEDRTEILATGKNVIIIGGGDSGADCVGTCNRQGAKSVAQFEWKPMPSTERTSEQPWPFWPMLLRTSSSHEEGCVREWGINTLELLGDLRRVTGVRCSQIEWVSTYEGSREMRSVPGSERVWPADLVIIAAGFLGPETTGVLSQVDVNIDARGNISADDRYMTQVPGVFACGDARRGQSLIVWAMSEGREAARHVDIFLQGETALPTKGTGDLHAIS